MLDKEFINRKIKLIGEDLAYLEELKDYTLDELSKDFYKLNAAERLLEKIVVRAADINNHLIAEMGAGTERVRGYFDSFIVLSKLGVYSREFAEKVAEKGKFRNVLVHEYNNLEKNLIHRKIREVLDDFRQYCGHILKFIEKQN